MELAFDPAIPRPPPMKTSPCPAPPLTAEANRSWTGRPGERSSRARWRARGVNCARQALVAQSAGSSPGTVCAVGGRSRTGRSWRIPSALPLSGLAGWGGCTPRRTPGCRTISRSSSAAGAGRRRRRRARAGGGGRRAVRLRHGEPRLARAADDPRVGRSASPRRTSCTARSAPRIAAAGKHIWIEKPVGLTADDAGPWPSGAQGGVQVTVGFNYRNAPAVEDARELIAPGGDRRGHARPGPAAQRLRRPPGGRPDLAVRAGPGRQRRARRPGVARRRPGPLPARRDRLARRRHRHLPPRAAPPGRGHRRARAGRGRRAGPGGERGLRLLPAAVRLRRPGRARGKPRLGRRAEQLRLRDARHQGRGLLGLPADGRARRQRRDRLPGPAGAHRLRRPRRRRVRRLPAGRGQPP